MAIISRQHNFIFIKTTKTAGTSIEVELSKRLCPDAIVTPVIPAIAGHEPRNWRRGILRRQYYNHMPATLVREFVGRSAFDRMYKFCVEREPVSKCISHFHMLKNSKIHAGLDDTDLTWERYCARAEFPIDTLKFAERVGGQAICVVDAVIPYETLNESLRGIMKRVGIEPFDITTKAKAEYSSKRYVRMEDVTAEQRATIYQAFANSIRLAGMEGIYKP